MSTRATFNLKRHLEKIANVDYEGAQGYFLAQQRAWMNCYKAKVESNMTPQKAWDSCCEEFQGGDQRLEWVGKYAAAFADKLKKFAQLEGAQAQMPEYWDRIAEKIESGKTTGQAVLETLEECKSSSNLIAVANKECISKDNDKHNITICCICDRPIRSEHKRKHPASTSSHPEYAHRDCLEQEDAYVDDMLSGSELAP